MNDRPNKVREGHVEYIKSGLSNTLKQLSTYIAFAKQVGVPVPENILKDYKTLQDAETAATQKAASAGGKVAEMQIYQDELARINSKQLIIRVENFLFKDEYVDLLFQKIYEPIPINPSSTTSELISLLNQRNEQIEQFFKLFGGAAEALNLKNLNDALVRRKADLKVLNQFIEANQANPDINIKHLQDQCALLAQKVADLEKAMLERGAINYAHCQYSHPDTANYNHLKVSMLEAYTDALSNYLAYRHSLPNNNDIESDAAREEIMRLFPGLEYDVIPGDTSTSHVKVNDELNNGSLQDVINHLMISVVTCNQFRDAEIKKEEASAIDKLTAGFWRAVNVVTDSENKLPIDFMWEAFARSMADTSNQFNASDYVIITKNDENHGSFQFDYDRFMGTASSLVNITTPESKQVQQVLDQERKKTDALLAKGKEVNADIKPLKEEMSKMQETINRIEEEKQKALEARRQQEEMAKQAALLKAQEEMAKQAAFLKEQEELQKKATVAAEVAPPPTKEAAITQKTQTTPSQSATIAKPSTLEDHKEQLFSNLVKVLSMDAWWREQGGNRFNHKIPKDINRVKNMLLMNIPQGSEYESIQFNEYHRHMDDMKKAHGMDRLTRNGGIYEELYKIAEEYRKVNQNTRLHFFKNIINNHHDGRADIYAVFRQLHEAVKKDDMNSLNALNRQLETFIEKNQQVVAHKIKK